MTRRGILVHLLGAGLIAALATGCVTQPLDEAAVELTTEQLGVTPIPLDVDDAEEVELQARKIGERHADGEDTDKVVWTKPKRGGSDDDTDGRVGLVRDGDSGVDGGKAKNEKPASDPDTDGEGSDSNLGRAGGSRDGRADGGGGGSGDATAGSGGGGGDNNKPSGNGTTDREPAKPKPSPKPAANAFEPQADVGDRDGDATGQSPGYADIRQLLIESNGQRARVTVAVAAPIPGALAEGEVQGVGIDFYRTDAKESDYQLFADGDASGWRAYLHTPDGIVQYPGTFGLGGRVFVFEVPWSALGGKQQADVDMFIDWSKESSPINRAGNDRAPNGGRVGVDPS